ncbi:MAG: hypothetical protein F6K10_18315 [Moorea sp. SIO2B7]|nr:hypothetical protein [Moorena sp. SIO2B7]
MPIKIPLYCGSNFSSKLWRYRNSFSPHSGKVISKKLSSDRLLILSTVRLCYANQNERDLRENEDGDRFENRFKMPLCYAHQDSLVLWFQLCLKTVALS